MKPDTTMPRLLGRALGLLASSMLVLHAIPATAATQEACERYARESVRQHQQSVALRTGFSPPVWSSDSQSHLNWCLQGNNSRTTPQHLAERERLLQEYALRGNDACVRYATETVRQVAESQQLNTGFAPPEWSDSYSGHLGQCKAAYGVGTPGELGRRALQLQAFVLAAPGQTKMQPAGSTAAVGANALGANAIAAAASRDSTLSAGQLAALLSAAGGQPAQAVTGAKILPAGKFSVDVARGEFVRPGRVWVIAKAVDANPHKGETIVGPDGHIIVLFKPWVQASVPYVVSLTMSPPSHMPSPNMYVIVYGAVGQELNRQQIPLTGGGEQTVHVMVMPAGMPEPHVYFGLQNTKNWNDRWHVKSVTVTATKLP